MGLLGVLFVFVRLWVCVCVSVCMRVRHASFPTCDSCYFPSFFFLIYFLRLFHDLFSWIFRHCFRHSFHFRSLFFVFVIFCFRDFVFHVCFHVLFLSFFRYFILRQFFVFVIFSMLHVLFLHVCLYRHFLLWTPWAHNAGPKHLNI